MLAIILPVRNGHHFSSLDMFVTLVVLILIPYIIGILFRLFFTLSPTNVFLKHGPMGALFIIVYSSIATCKNSLFQLHFSTLIWLVCMALIINLLFFYVIYLITNITKVHTKASKALIFSCGTKTLPMSLILIGLMAFPNGDAVVAAIVYYFVQLISGSIVASFLSGRKKFKRVF